jgi:hypothetical protein
MKKKQSAVWLDRAKECTDKACAAAKREAAEASRKAADAKRNADRKGAAMRRKKSVFG